jgi:hypothetical protein
MDEFAILGNRRRALIALIHSLFFLAIAVRGFASPRAAVTFHGPGRMPALVLLVIYGIVTTILSLLAGLARSAKEKLYFVLCAGSASFGFIRILLGDSAIPAAQYARVLMLLCAVFVGIWIYLGHGESALAE